MSLSHFSSDGVDIAYRDEGEGSPVLLVHGFSSSSEVNWVGTGWMKAIAASGRRAIAIDNRGHGQSEKLYETAKYATHFMSEDAVRLLDHLGIEKAVMMGYSMGTRITAYTALHAPERLRAIVLSGLATGLIEGVGGSEAIAEAMEAPSASDVTDPAARAFRVFAEQTGGDRRALAACIRISRSTLSADEVGEITVPTLVVTGDKDTISGPAEGLAALIPGARAVTLKGRDHMTAVGDKGHKEAVLAFLDELGPW